MAEERHLDRRQCSLIADALEQVLEDGKEKARNAVGREELNDWAEGYGYNTWFEAKGDMAAAISALREGAALVWH